MLVVWSQFSQPLYMLLVKWQHFFWCSIVFAYENLKQIFNGVHMFK